MKRRPGLSLLEVLVALAIFLLAIVAIGRLVVLAGEQALDVKLQSQAAQIAESKLAEIAVGAVALESQSEVPVEEDPDWLWSLDVPGLWNVTVRVLRMRPEGTLGEYCSLSQMILDPSLRGSTQDTVTISGTTNPDTSGGASSPSGSSGSSPSSGQPSTGSPAAASPSPSPSPVGGGFGGSSPSPAGGGFGGAMPATPGGSGNRPSGSGGNRGGP
jgi:general secretion pathway protein I